MLLEKREWWQKAKKRGCRKKWERERNLEGYGQEKRDGKKLESEKRRKDRKRRIKKILPQLLLFFSPLLITSYPKHFPFFPFPHKEEWYSGVNREKLQGEEKRTEGLWEGEGAVKSRERRICSAKPRRTSVSYVELFKKNPLIVWKLILIGFDTPKL